MSVCLWLRQEKSMTIICIVLKKQDNIVKEYVADSVGSVIAERCVTLLGKELDKECEFRHSLPYSPGYCGWDIREQQKLFSLFPPQPCGITLSDSFLMSPVKSVSGFFRIRERAASSALPL